MHAPQINFFFIFSSLLIMGIMTSFGIILTYSIWFGFKWYYITVQGLLMDIVGAVLIVMPIVNSLNAKNVKQIDEINRFSALLGIVILVIGFVLQIIVTIVTNGN